MDALTHRWLVFVMAVWLTACNGQATATPVPPTMTPTFTSAPPASPTATSVPTTPVSIFGVELSQLSEAGGLSQARNANALWVRRAGVWWPDVEPVEGERHWEALAGMEAEFEAASASGARIILVVRGVPAWAQAKPGHSCGPIAANKLPAFADFMAALVARYSVSPYSVLYWELGNEPDVASELVAPDSPFGCWGDDSDPYYGGGYYAEMLKVIYPSIKAAAPEAQVLIGGLLLDCNPDLPSRCTNNRPPRFLEGILRSGGGPFFDGVSFHAYDYYGEQAGVYGHFGWNSTWDTTGPVMTAKARFLRKVLAQYKMSDKFLMNTESALICGRSGDEPECQTSAFASTKADYVAQVYAAALAEGLRANVWYNWTGWRGSGLVDADLKPTTAHDAYQFAASQLSQATFQHRLTEFPGVAGYEFALGTQRMWIVWAATKTNIAFSLPSLPQSCWTTQGLPLIPTRTVQLSERPLYIEWQHEKQP